MANLPREHTNNRRSRHGEGVLERMGLSLPLSACLSPWTLTTLQHPNIPTSATRCSGAKPTMCASEGDRGEVGGGGGVVAGSR